MLRIAVWWPVSLKARISRTSEAVGQPGAAFGGLECAFFSVGMGECLRGELTGIPVGAGVFVAGENGGALCFEAGKKFGRVAFAVEDESEAVAGKKRNLYLRQTEVSPEEVLQPGSLRFLGSGSRRPEVRMSERGLHRLGRLHCGLKIAHTGLSLFAEIKTRRFTPRRFRPGELRRCGRRGCR
jgi:hypothetical protein